MGAISPRNSSQFVTNLIHNQIAEQPRASGAKDKSFPRRPRGDLQMSSLEDRLCAIEVDSLNASNPLTKRSRKEVQDASYGCKRPEADPHEFGTLK